MLGVPQDMHRAIGNIELVLPLDYKRALRLQILVHFEDKEAKFFVVFVADYVEIILCNLVHDLQDTVNFKFQVKNVALLVFGFPEVDEVAFFGRYDHDDHIVVVGLHLQGL